MDYYFTAEEKKKTRAQHERYVFALTVEEFVGKTKKKVSATWTKKHATRLQDSLLTSITGLRNWT